MAICDTYNVKVFDLMSIFCYGFLCDSVPCPVLDGAL